MAEQVWQQRKVAIVGVGTTRQGSHPGKTTYQLAMDAVRDAMADAGLTDKSRITGLLTAKQLDGSGVDPLELSRFMGISPRATGMLDYGTGGFTTQYGALMIASGMCDVVMCVFARNPPNTMTDLSGAGVYDRDLGFYNAAAASAFGWTQYRAKYDADEETLGRVMVTARQYAAMNPIAAWKEPLSLGDYLAQPYLIWPLRSYDICKVTAGAVAIIMARGDMAHDFAKKPVFLHAVGRQQAPGILDDDEHFLCRGMRAAARQVYQAADMIPDDIDVLYVSDASTVAIPLTLENYGFCGEGGAGDFLKNGGIGLGGKTPVNTHGGQLSEGYLVGWLHHAELVRQLRGECGARQVKAARVAQYTTTGRLREDYLSSIYVAG